MSIQTELTRLTNAKSAIKAAIEGKGVTVPDGTRLDGMAEAIAAIQTGGLYPIYYKEVTFAEDMKSTYTVDTSDCPFDPDERKTSWVVWQKGAASKGLHVSCSMTSLYYSGGSSIRGASSGRTLTGMSTKYNYGMLTVTPTGLNINFTGSSFFVAAAGTTYAILGIKLVEDVYGV